MSRFVALALAGALLAGCSSDGEPTEPSLSSSPAAETPTGSTPAEPERYALEGCPVLDEAFCTTAFEVGEALQAGDTEVLFVNTRESRLVCADLAMEYFPACETEDVLTGYALSGANFLVEVVDEARYRAQLDAIVGSIDPAFSDELGSGEVQLVGVGTCGPDVPGRRTYHLAWTAAVSEAGAPAERLLGSFEFTFQDEEWRTELWYLDPLVEWEAEQPDPLDLAFCEAGLTPWPPADV